MPIDFLGKRNQAEDATKQLLEGRNLGTDIAGITANRNNFLSRIGGQISGQTGLAPSYSQKVPALDRKLQGLAAKAKYSGTRQKYDSLFQNALQRAQEAGYDINSATAYARKVADQTAGMSFQAGEAQKGRDFSRKMNTVKNQYQDMGAQLEDQYNQPDNDYSGALARVLMGTGVSLGTNYLMTKNLMSKQNAGGAGSAGGTMFSGLTPYSEGASGRAPQPFTGEADYSGFSRPGFSRVRG